MEHYSTKHIKAVNFDLDTKALKKHYPKPKSWRKAYKDIKSFLKDNGFKKKQWSGYISKQPMTVFEVDLMMYKMTSTFSWLKHCVNAMDVTNADGKYDYIDIIKSNNNSVLLKDEHIANSKSSSETSSKDNIEDQQISSKVSDKKAIDIAFDNSVQFDDYDEYEDEYSKGR